MCRWASHRRPIPARPCPRWQTPAAAPACRRCPRRQWNPAHSALLHSAAHSAPPQRCPARRNTVRPGLWARRSALPQRSTSRRPARSRSDSRSGKWRLRAQIRRIWIPSSACPDQRSAQPARSRPARYHRGLWKIPGHPARRRGQNPCSSAHWAFHSCFPDPSHYACRLTLSASRPQPDWLFRPERSR